MDGLYFVLPTMLAVVTSMFVVRAGAVALYMTGMEMKRAQFQALSAFSNTGFTTREAERIVNHPLRREIVTWLIILGHAGIVTVIVTATSTLAGSDGLQIPLSATLLLLGTALAWFVGSRAGLTQRWERWVERRLRRSRAFEDMPVADMLHLLDGLGVGQLSIDAHSPLAGKTLAGSGLASRGCLVLGVERDGEFNATPSGADEIRAGDRLVIYGKLQELAKETDEGALRRGF